MNHQELANTNEILRNTYSEALHMLLPHVEEIVSTVYEFNNQQLNKLKEMIVKYPVEIIYDDSENLEDFIASCKSHAQQMLEPQKYSGIVFFVNKNFDAFGYQLGSFTNLDYTGEGVIFQNLIPNDLIAHIVCSFALCRTLALHKRGDKPAKIVQISITAPDIDIVKTMNAANKIKDIIQILSLHAYGKEFKIPIVDTYSFKPKLAEVLTAIPNVAYTTLLGNFNASIHLLPNFISRRQRLQTMQDRLDANKIMKSSTIKNVSKPENLEEMELLITKLISGKV